MKTPKEKYLHDPYYRRLVDTIEAVLHDAQLTPSEVREAAILACIVFESKRLESSFEFRLGDDVENAFKILSEWTVVKK